MNTNRHESESEERGLFLKDKVFQLVGCAMEVLNGIGHGLHEKVYENALVGEFIPDLITHGAVVADTKVIDRIIDHERGQLINYLRIAKLRVGVFLNFKHAKLEWERIIL